MRPTIRQERKQRRQKVPHLVQSGRTAGAGLARLHAQSTQLQIGAGDQRMAGIPCKVTLLMFELLQELHACQGGAHAKASRS